MPRKVNGALPDTNLSTIRNRIVGHVELYPSEIQDHPGQAWDHPVGQVKSLTGILRQYGIVDELLVYKSPRAGGAYVAIDGHLRKGLDPHRAWPCTVVDLTDEEADGVLLTFDLVGQMKQANVAALDALLASVEIQDEAVQKMLAAAAAETGLYLDGRADNRDAEIDEAQGEELRQKWGVELGQVWQLGRHRLMVGDCTDCGVVGRLFGARQADLALTSPPYAVGKEYEVGVSFQEHLALLAGFAERGLEVIKAGGFCVINFAEIYTQAAAGPLTGSRRACIYPIQLDYWRIFHVERAYDLYATRIWRKPFNKLAISFRSFDTSLPHEQEFEHIWTWRLPGGSGDRAYDEETSLRAVWDTSAEQSDKPLQLHVAAFPPGVPRRALLAHSAAGDLVWEPFAGSGTTLIVAEQLGRVCYATELRPDYAALILERYQVAFGAEPQLEQSDVIG